MDCDKLTPYEASVRTAQATKKGIMFTAFPTRLLRQREQPERGQTNTYVLESDLIDYLESNDTDDR